MVNSDEGVILNGAWDLFNGRKIYFDFFELTPPGAYYLIFGLWKIFGAYYYVAKIASAIAVFLSGIGIYKIIFALNKKISKQRLNKYALLCVFIFLVSSISWPIISYHIFNLFFLIWSVYFFILSLESNHFKYILISGSLTGFAMFFLQHKTVVLLCVLFSYLLFLSLINKKKEWLIQMLLLILSSSFVIILLFSFWPKGLLFKNLILFPLFNYTETAMIPFDWMIIFLIILIFAAISLKKIMDRKIAFLVYLQFGLLLSTFSLADHFHVILVLFPSISLLPFIIGEVNKSKLRYFYIVGIYTAIILITFPSLIYFRIPLSDDTKLEAIEYVKNNCDESKYLYAGPFLSGLYFETKKLNPTPYSWLITNHHTKEQFEQAKELIEQKRPSCVILNYKIVEKYKYNIDNPVDNFIRQNYRQILGINYKNFIIYKIK